VKINGENDEGYSYWINITNYGALRINVPGIMGAAFD